MKISKRIAALVIASLAQFLTSSVVHADGIVSASTNGKTFVYYTASSKVTEDDIKKANNGCAKMGGTECQQIIRAPFNNVIVTAKNQNGLFTAADPSPQIALKEALAGCNKAYGKCQATFIGWVAYEPSAAFAWSKDKDGQYEQSYFAYDYETKEEAEAAALDGCKKEGGKNCQKVGSWDGEIFLAHARSSDNRIGFAFSGNSLAAAQKDAIKECNKESKKADCKVLNTFHNPGPTPTPKGYQAIYKTIAAHNVAAANNAQRVVSRSAQNNVLTCHNRCMNGDCLRTFPNGRTERWQAPRVFDGATGDWKWETNSCGN